jgi:hypothetical protein
MKKIQFLFVILLALVMVSCMDQENQTLNTNPTTNTGTLTCDEHDHGNLEKGFFSGKVAIGHKGSECNNSCVYINGKPTHFDCQSWGSACTINPKLTLKSNGDGTYFATSLNAEDITALDLFNMPDRSIYVGLDENNNEQWINIPAQLSYKDAITQQFTFKDVFITEKQFYPNK